MKRSLIVWSCLAISLVGLGCVKRTVTLTASSPLSEPHVSNYFLFRSKGGRPVEDVRTPAWDILIAKEKRKLEDRTVKAIYALTRQSHRCPRGVCSEVATPPAAQPEVLQPSAGEIILSGPATAGEEPPVYLVVREDTRPSADAQFVAVATGQDTTITFGSTPLVVGIFEIRRLWALMTPKPACDIVSLQICNDPMPRPVSKIHF